MPPGVQAPSVPPVTPPAESSGSKSGAVIAIAVLLSFIIASFAGLTAGFLGARIAGGGFGSGGGFGGPVRGVQQVEVLAPKTDEPIVAAAAAGLPSVVNIDVRGGGTSSKDSGLPQDHPSVPSSGNGSGVAFKSTTDGGTYIITNNHVVENADTLTVRDATGQSIKAELIGTDPESDIAVVKVDRKIPVIKIANSGRLSVGQAVVAIGSPFGLEHSVTSGVISALGRALTDFTGSASDKYPLIDAIQTDAAINPGNSGGALVDRMGKLVGINTAIYSDTGQNGGIGFAVPSNTAIRVAEQLIKGGGVTHPFLGVVGQTITPEFAQQEKLSATEGVWVASTTPGSGAQKADIQKGDVISAVDGVTVRSIDDLILNVRRKQVGDTVKLTLSRGGEQMTVDVVVGDKPADLKPVTPDSSAPDTGTPGK
jgi:S1-C subfamily serine protease